MALTDNQRDSLNNAAFRGIFNLDLPVADRGADPAEYQARLDRALALTDDQLDSLKYAVVRGIFNLDVPVADRGAGPEYQERLDRALALTRTQVFHILDVCNLYKASIRRIFNLDVPVADRGAGPEYQTRLNRALALTDDQRNNLNCAAVRRIFNLNVSHRFTGVSFYEERLELALSLTRGQLWNIAEPSNQDATGITKLLGIQARRRAERVAFASIFSPKALTASKEPCAASQMLDPEVERYIGGFL